jgi:acetyl esterase/lipase
MKLKAIIFLSFCIAPAFCPAQTTTPTVTVTPTQTPTVTPSPTSSPVAVPFNYTGTPTPTPSPASLPLATPIPHDFQPPQEGIHSPTLEWRIFAPTGSGPWPAVIVLHIGGFYSGNIYDEDNNSPQDLAAAGFYTVVASYRLAPPFTITDQYPHDTTSLGIASGRPPEQTDDVKAEVNALRADKLNCTGQVGILGGSAGASHAAFVALDTTVTLDWPVWDGGRRPNFVACLSGAYDFSDRSDPTDYFIKTTENYTNTTLLSHQWNVSPIAYVTTDVIPMYFIHSENDSMPPNQQWDMYNAGKHRGQSGLALFCRTVGKG